MEQISRYIKPELLIVSVVLYFLGIAFKKSQIVPDKYIPLALGGIGILICALYVFASCPCNGWRSRLMAGFTVVTQGILTAGLSTYINQIFKQLIKDK